MTKRIRRCPESGPVKTRLGHDWRPVRQRLPKPQYFIYQLSGWLLGVSFGSDGAKRYEWTNDNITIYDKSDNVVLTGTFRELLNELRKVKWPNYPWS